MAFLADAGYMPFQTVTVLDLCRKKHPQIKEVKDGPALSPFGYRR
jgi:hypothetical protein